MPNPVPTFRAAFRGAIGTRTLWCTLLIGLLSGCLFALTQGPVSRAVISSNEIFQTFALSSDARTVASVSGEGPFTIQLWETSSGRQLHTLMVEAKTVTSLVFSPNDQTVAAVMENGMVRVWKVATGRLNETYFDGPWQTKLTVMKSISFSKGGRLVLGASADYGVDLWDVRTQTKLATVRPDFGFPRIVSTGLTYPGWPHYGVEGHAVTTENSSNARVWDLATGELRVHLPEDDFGGLGAVSADGSTFAIWGGKGWYVVEAPAGLPRPLNLGNHPLVRGLTTKGRVIAWVELAAVEMGFR